MRVGRGKAAQNSEKQELEGDGQRGGKRKTKRDFSLPMPTALQGGGVGSTGGGPGLGRGEMWSKTCLCGCMRRRVRRGRWRRRCGRWQGLRGRRLAA